MHWAIQGGIVPLILTAVVMFLINPLHYLATALILWDLVRNIRQERQWFGIRVTRIAMPLLFRYLKACVVGLVASLLLLAVGATVSWQMVAFVVGLSIVVGFVRTRFASTPFVVSIALVLASIAHYVPLTSNANVNIGITFLRGFQIESWLLIGIVACLSELLLQWWNRRDAVLPVLMTSKRGRRIGALKIQLGFSIPLLVWITPTKYATLSFSGSLHPWLLSGQAVSLGALSVICGLHALFTSLKPERVLVQWRWLNAIQGAILAGGFAIIFWLHTNLGCLSGVLLIVVSEIARSLWRRVDASSEPVYGPDARGVMILYTIRNSLSHKLGLQPGEVITHVNQTPVFTEYDLHFAFEQNPAYAKFQVIDLKGEMRLVGNPVYEGERHQLGLLVVLPSDVPALKLHRPLGFLETVYLRK